MAPGLVPFHQPPEVNYMAILENGEIKQEVHLRSVPCRGYRRCENLDLVDFWWRGVVPFRGGPMQLRMSS